MAQRRKIRAAFRHSEDGSKRESIVNRASWLSIAHAGTRRRTRLDHPELCEVARRVRVLGAKRGAEGVDVRHGHRERLDLRVPVGE